MVEIGTVRIKIFGGVVRDLIDVWYVPQRKKNNISVGVVESKRLKVIIENGILNMTKRSRVVMKDVREENLYYLKCSTVTCTFTASVDSDDDTIKL